MTLLDWLGLRKNRIQVPAFGGGIRPTVVGPQAIQKQLAFYAFLRTFLTSIIVVVALVCLGLAIRTPSIMATELFVADGSALGCLIPSYEGTE